MRLMRSREGMELRLAGFLSMVIAFFAPHAKYIVINGREEAVVMIAGHQIYGFGMALVCGVVFALVYGLVVLVGRRLYPIPVEAAPKSKTEIHQRKFNEDKAKGNVGFIGTPQTTAEEFMRAQRPPSTSLPFIGFDAWQKEIQAFEEAETAWLKVAPEATLRGLIPACEKLSKGLHPRFVEDMVERLWEANELRGIPTVEEIGVLQERLKLIVGQD